MTTWTLGDHPEPGSTTAAIVVKRYGRTSYFGPFASATDAAEYRTARLRGAGTLVVLHDPVDADPDAILAMP